MNTSYLHSQIPLPLYRNEYCFAWSKFEKLFEDHFVWENN